MENYAGILAILASNPQLWSIIGVSWNGAPWIMPVIGHFSWGKYITGLGFDDLSKWWNDVIQVLGAQNNSFVHFLILHLWSWQDSFICNLPMGISSVSHWWSVPDWGYLQTDVLPEAPLAENCGGPLGCAPHCEVYPYQLVQLFHQFPPKRLCPSLGHLINLAKNDEKWTVAMRQRFKTKKTMNFGAWLPLTMQRTSKAWKYTLPIAIGFRWF